MDETVERIRIAEAEERAQLALARYVVSRDAVPVAIRLGENDVFRVDDPGQGALALRIHRQGYQDEETVRSELAWVGALAADGIPVAEPLPGHDGDLVQRAGDDADAPLAVLFRWIEAEESADPDDGSSLEMLGQVLGRIHRHGRAWTPPEGFRRQSWDLDGLVGERPIHGSFAALDAVAADDMAVLVAARDVARERLAHLPRDERAFWGLIHGDFCWDNAVLTADGPVIVDFDDCGFGWPVYDVAVALAPHDGEAGFARRRDVLLKGYESVKPFPGEQYACLDHVVMAQHLMGLGWLASHPDSPFVADTVPAVARAVAAARRFLAAFG